MTSRRLQGKDHSIIDVENLGIWVHNLRTGPRMRAYFNSLPCFLNGLCQELCFLYYRTHAKFKTG